MSPELLSSLQTLDSCECKAERSAVCWLQHCLGTLLVRNDLWDSLYLSCRRSVFDVCGCLHVHLSSYPLEEILRKIWIALNCCSGVTGSRGHKSGSPVFLDNGDWLCVAFPRVMSGLLARRRREALFAVCAELPPVMYLDALLV